MSVVATGSRATLLASKLREPYPPHATVGGSRQARHVFLQLGSGIRLHGTRTSTPKDWIDDVLKRSQFDLNKTEVDGQSVWTTEGLDPEEVVSNSPSATGYAAFRFHNGGVVGLGLDALSTFSKKDAPFVHHLALSMLLRCCLPSLPQCRVDA